MKKLKRFVSSQFDAIADKNPECDRSRLKSLGEKLDLQPASRPVPFMTNDFERMLFAPLSLF